MALGGRTGYLGTLDLRLRSQVVEIAETRLVQNSTPPTFPENEGDCWRTEHECMLSENAGPESLVCGGCGERR